MEETTRQECQLEHSPDVTRDDIFSLEAATTEAFTPLSENVLAAYGVGRTMKADFGPGRSLVWLSSYPKSGNTWLRAMLAALDNPDRSIDLSALPYGMRLFDRGLLDDFAAITSADMTAPELIPYQAALFAVASQEAEQPTFAKTHAAMATGAGNTPLFQPQACAGAIYITRDPLDVAVSFAHHDALSFDEAIDRMSDPNFTLHDWGNKSSPNVPQLMGSWSDHVTGWTNAPPFPVLVLRYEDMLADAARALEQVAQFAQLPASREEVAKAAEACQFDRLRSQEEEGGFREKPSASRAFFRAGRSGDGRKTLSSSQVEAIVHEHGKVMRKFGYLA